MAAVLLAPLAVAPAAAQTPAGTRIENIATLSHDGVDSSSNTVVLVVDEIIDAAVTADRAQQPVEAGGEPLAIAFTVVNPGNAAGRFTLTAVADRDAEVLGVAADSDGDGRYDAMLTGQTVTLAAGERRRLFVLVRGPAPVGASVSLSIAASRGHGAPGTVLPADANGGEAVIGQTGAAATATTRLVDGAGAGPRLDKSQTVLAPDGSARARPGATITYRLDARFAGPTRAVAIADAVPAGTRFVPGSITLDGRALTDADDADAASFDGTTVRVALGDVAAAGVRSIQFQTIIQ